MRDVSGARTDKESLENDISKYTQTVLAIALNFDFVTTDQSGSRADEIKLLTVKNKRQSKKSKEKKPPGIGCPTGGVESGETLERAVLRETIDESGYGTGAKIIGKIYQEHRHTISNSIHVFLLDVDGSYVVKVRERDEIDPGWDTWITLRQVLQMPYAIDRNGRSKNPNGIYYSHVRRFLKTLNVLVLSNPKDLPKEANAWIDKYFDILASAMNDLLRDGLVSLSEDDLIIIPNRETGNFDFNAT